MDWTNRIPNIQNKLKAQLHAKKVDNLEGLYNLVQKFDADKSGFLDYDEFYKFLSALGIFFSTQEFRAVYDHYDLNKDGKIAFVEFIQMIRNQMSETRLAVVKQAYLFLDREKNGRLPIELLETIYRAQCHPRVRTRQKTAQQVKEEFLTAIKRRSADGVNITEQEFLDYYADVNATLPDEREEYFVDILENTWGFKAAQDYVPPKRLEDLENLFYEKLRQATPTDEDVRLTLRKAMHLIDLEERGKLDIAQFKQLLYKFGCVYSEKEVHALFAHYDSDQSGFINEEELFSHYSTLSSTKILNKTLIFEIKR